MNDKLMIRTGALKLIIGVLFLFLFLRVYYLTVVNGDEIRARAQKQNSLSVEVADGRSNIYDRHLRAITGVEKTNYAVVFSDGNRTVDFDVCKDLAKYSDESEYDIYGRLYKYGKTTVKVNNKIDEEFEKNHRTVKILTSNVRYAQDSPASSVIGYVSDGEGVMGLEKVYNDQLKAAEDLSVSARSDALRNFIPGGGFEVAGQTVGSNMLKTTLDLKATRICQQALDDAGVKGAAVLLDVNSFDVLAMASSPDFDQNNVAEYLDSPDGNLNNRCLQAYDLGSIFKIVVSAAALESGAVELDDKFYCNGYIEVSGKRFDCHKAGGHGEVTFEEAFMYSCNPVFIDIGNKTGYTNILEMAKRFGVGEKLLHPLEFDQSAGTLPDENNYYMADLANLSIGQGSLSSTVLQGCVFSAVIANGGTRKAVNLADSIIDNVGQVRENLRVESETQVIAPEIAQKIFDMMVKTNISGTGTPGNLDEYGGSGGKTGSAETGWYVDGERQQHGWYSGFFPVDNPQYALCVLVENGKSGGESAGPIFKEIGENILKLQE